MSDILGFTEEDIGRKINSYSAEKELHEDLGLLFHKTCRPAQRLSLYVPKDCIDPLQAKISRVSAGYEKLARVLKSPETKERVIKELHNALGNFIGSVSESSEGLEEERVESVKYNLWKITHFWNSFLGTQTEFNLGGDLRTHQKAMERELAVYGIQYDLQFFDKFKTPIDYFMVVDNLIGNVMKHAFPNKKDNKILTVQEIYQEKCYTIKVNDNGIGIKRENLEKIWEPGFSNGNRNCHGLGKGLGLPESEKIVESKGGIIVVDSMPEVYACFMFTIPFEECLK